MRKEEIIATLQKDRQHLKDAFGVESIALFGSYAKGIENSDSDVDFLVEFKNPSYSVLMDLYLYLEITFKSKIDIVRKGPHLSKRFLNTIQKEMIYV